LSDDEWYGAEWYARCIECGTIYDVERSDAINPDAFCSFECQELAD